MHGGVQPNKRRSWVERSAASAFQGLIHKALLVKDG